MAEPNRPDPTDEAEADETLAALTSQAEEWRRLLADPTTAHLVRSGVIAVSPLVSDLLAAFPRKSTG